MGEPAILGHPAERSLWLSYQAMTNGVVTFTTAGSTFDTVLAAYHGTSVNALDLIDADDDHGPTYTSLISFAMTNGEAVEVKVDNYPGSSGAFQLGWTLVPTQYSDGGYTGANIERPGVRQGAGRRGCQVSRDRGCGHGVRRHPRGT